MSPIIITIGNKVAKSKPVLRFPPTASAILPTIEGPAAATRSPANAKKANIAVPPVGHFCEEMQSVPGHIMPTASPHIAHPIKPIIGMGDRAAV